MTKKPYIAAILSFLIAGLGQLYLGRIKRGALFLFFEVVTAYLAFEVHEFGGSILNISVSLMAAYDAYKIAKQPVKKTEKKPEDGAEHITLY